MNPTVKELEQLITDGLKRYPLPMVKGNSIRIGKVAIRFSKNKGYILFDCEEKISIAVCQNKTAAVCAAKKYLANQPLAKVLEFDKDLEKHKIDCMYYEATMNSKNASDFRKEVAETRYLYSKGLADNISTELYNTVMKSI
jgi:hypothetical protein